jgi:hypothetical protein
LKPSPEPAAIKCRPYRVDFGQVLRREDKPPKKKPQVNQSLRVIYGGEGVCIEKSEENLKNYQSGSEAKYLRHLYAFPKSYFDTKSAFEQKIKWG